MIPVSVAINQPRGGKIHRGVLFTIPIDIVMVVVIVVLSIGSAAGRPRVCAKAAATI